MNVCRIMGDSVGDTNGLEFCNCHAAVREGRKLTYPTPTPPRINTSVKHPQSLVRASAVRSDEEWEAGWPEEALCDWTGVKSPGMSWSCLVWLWVCINLDYELCCAELKFVFPFLFWTPTWNELTQMPYYLAFILLCRAQRRGERRCLVLSLVSAPPLPAVCLEPGD